MKTVIFDLIAQRLGDRISFVLTYFVGTDKQDVLMQAKKYLRQFFSEKTELDDNEIDSIVNDFDLDDSIYYDVYVYRLEEVLDDSF